MIKMTELRQEQHIVDKGRICPNCGKKDTIIYWKRKGHNLDLYGNKIDNMVRIKPTCTACKKTFSKGTLFKIVR